MGNKYIIVNLNMFSLNNQVYIVGRESELQGEYTMDQLPGIVAMLSRENGIYNVKIAGNALYAEELIHQIEITETLKYHEKKIKVEVA